MTKAVTAADHMEILKKVRAALERELRINLHRYPIRIGYNETDQTVTLQGEVSDIAAKKLALEAAVGAPGVRGIVDRLRVKPGALMTDDEIRLHTRDALLQEPTLKNCAIRTRTREKEETFNDPIDRLGDVLIIVGDGMVQQEGDDQGMVLLEGRVPSLSHKRLAGVLAWWVPGSRDVLNSLEVVPPEEDNDDEIADAVRIVLEKDPFIDASQIRASVRDRVVTLEGSVASDGVKEMAESDAWCLFGVDKVINRLEVRS